MIQTKHAVVVVLGLSFLTWTHEQNVKKERLLNVTPQKTTELFKTYAFCSHDGRVSLHTLQSKWTGSTDCCCCCLPKLDRETVSSRPNQLAIPPSPRSMSISCNKTLVYSSQECENYWDFFLPLKCKLSLLKRDLCCRRPKFHRVNCFWQMCTTNILTGTLVQVICSFTLMFIGSTALTNAY